MLLLVHSPHEWVMSFLEAADADAMVGPTSHAGWTAAWIDAARATDVSAAGTRGSVTIEEAPEGIRLHLLQPGSARLSLTWPRRPGDSAPDAAADRLASMLAGDADSLREVLTGAHDDADALIARLDRLLDLPELVRPAPDRTVVAGRADPSLVRMACAAAGPARACATTGGWTLAVPVEPADPGALAAAMSAAGRRTQRTLLAWQADPACGIQVWQGGRVEAAWEWGGGWEDVLADRLTVESQVCTALVATSGSDVHLPTLRALLRRRGDADSLRALTELLGLPEPIIDALDSPPLGDGPPWELVPRVPPLRAALSTFWSAGQRPVTGRLRPLYVTYAAATVMACAVSVAMTVLSIAVIVTDGSVVDQAGAGGQDWLALAGFALLSLVLLAAARHRVRRVREGGPGSRS